jgi:hypothetical protein
MDGTYTGTAGMIDPPTGLSGTDGNQIKIRAINDGEALIDGEDARLTIRLADENSWFVLEGFNARNSVNGSETVDIGRTNSSFNIIRRLVAWNNVAQHGSFPITVRSGAQENLIEDSAFFGMGRKACGMLSSNGMNTIWRRVWCRWEGFWINPSGTTTGGPKMAMTGMYHTDSNPNGSGTIAENLIGTWTGERNCIAPEGCDERYGLITGDGDNSTPSSTGSKMKILGSFGYLKPGANFATDFVMGLIGHSTAGGFMVKDSVAYTVGFSNVGFKFNTSTTTFSEASNLIAIGGTAPTYPGSLTGSNREHGATINDVSNPYDGLGGEGGPLCYEYQDGVVTSIPLWPWRMDQRIKAAINLAGSSVLGGDGTVTGEVESLLGTIPSTCKRS